LVGAYDRSDLKLRSAQSRSKPPRKGGEVVLKWLQLAGDLGPGSVRRRWGEGDQFRIGIGFASF
jgi:hypothetical protein